LVGYDDYDAIERTFRLHSGSIYLKLMDRIICNSRKIEEGYRRNGYQKNTIYVPNGVDTKHFRPMGVDARQDLRREYNISLGKKALIYSGTISARKNILFLIEVMRILNQTGHNYQLLLCAPASKKRYPSFDREYYFEVKNSVTKGNMGHEVFILSDGFDMDKMLQLSDVYVSASQAEGMPNSVLEAMACGLPVVALDLDENLSGLIQHGENGYLVTEKNPTIFAQYVKEIDGNNDLKKEMGRKNRNKTVSFHNMNRVSVQYLEVIHR
jgi:glycosyltransferase involved in cell wall biosynthesis